MTYLDLIRDADRKLDKGHITLGRYEEMIEPLKREMQPEIIRCKDCKYMIDAELLQQVILDVCLQKGEPMDDLISRQAAIDAVNEYATIWMSYTDDMSASDIAQEAINSAKDTMIRILKEQPTAQPGRKPGRWKEHIFEGIMGGRPRALMCNQCNSLSLHATNFCPNCGADMRGGESE